MLSPQEKSHIRSLFHNRTERDFPPQALEIIYTKQLFRLFIPGALGGKECALPEAMRIIEDCARADGDFGWAVQIGSGGGFFAGFFQDEVAQKLFTQKEFIIAGSGFPGGRARKEGEGYKVNGQWKYASGCGYATLFTASCFLNDTEQIRACAFRPEQVKILDDWDAYGMQHTLSHSIKVENALVPEEMTFHVTQLVNDYGYKLYNFPFMIFARSCILSSLAGCFGHLLEEVQNFIQKGSSAPGKLSKLKELHQKVSAQHGEVQKEVLEKAEQAWTATSLEQAAPEEIIKAFDAAMRNQIDFINREAYRIFNAVGMAATEQSSQLNKVWRDLTTAAQHMILK